LKGILRRQRVILDGGDEGEGEEESGSLLMA